MPEQAKRGVHWVREDFDFEDMRTLMAVDSKGHMILEMRMPSRVADSAAEDLAWEWLNAHDFAEYYPEEMGESARPVLTCSLGGNKPPRKSKSKREPARPELHVVQ
jgi:hypothetical protein